MPEPTNVNNQSQEGQESQGQQSQPEKVAWDQWIETQPDEIKQAYQEHTTGLQNTVRATRQERDDLKGQLTEALKSAEKGSALETQLTNTLTRLDEAEKRADFIEEAIKPEIGCSNTKAAWLIAQADNLFDRKGYPNWEAIKQAAPELFIKPIAKGNAGTGAGSPPAGKIDMNQLIRNKAGKQ